MIGADCFIAYADPRFNKIRVIQCVISRIVSGDTEEGERYEFKAIELLAEAGVHVNRYYYLPTRAIHGVGLISIVRLLEERYCMEPALIHTPVAATMVMAEDNSKILGERIGIMKDALIAVTGVEPAISYQITPEAFQQTDCA